MREEVFVMPLVIAYVVLITASFIMAALTYDSSEDSLSQCFWQWFWALANLMAVMIVIIGIVALFIACLLR